METMLVLVFWVVTGPKVYVPMPDWPTCEEAIVEAETELNPYTAYCTEVPVRRLKAVTPRPPTPIPPTYKFFVVSSATVGVHVAPDFSVGMPWPSWPTGKMHEYSSLEECEAGRKAMLPEIKERDNPWRKWAATPCGKGGLFSE
jgi:hypothetical protein